jgi:hypothetical protein
VVAVGEDDAGRLDVRKLSGATGAALWGPVTWTDPQAVTSFGVDVALTRAGDVMVLAEVGDVTAWRALVLELDGGTGAALVAPKSYGGTWAVGPRALALRDDAPVVGLYSSVTGPEVVSWSGPAPALSRPAR